MRNCILGTCSVIIVTVYLVLKMSPRGMNASYVANVPAAFPATICPIAQRIRMLSLSDKETQLEGALLPHLYLLNVFTETIIAPPGTPWHPGKSQLGIWGSHS